MCIATTQTVDMISLVCIVLLAPLVACQGSDWSASPSDWSVATSDWSGASSSDWSGTWTSDWSGSWTSDWSAYDWETSSDWGDGEWRDDTSNCIQADPRSGILTVSAHEYYDNMDICWRISGNVTVLVPVYLDVEGPFPDCPWDTIYVTDGVGQEFTTCGSPLDNQPMPPPFHHFPSEFPAHFFPTEFTDYYSFDYSSDYYSSDYSSDYYSSDYSSDYYSSEYYYSDDSYDYYGSYDYYSNDFYSSDYYNPGYDHYQHDMRMMDFYRMSPITTFGDVYVRFHTDQSVTKSGFAISYAAAPQ